MTSSLEHGSQVLVNFKVSHYCHDYFLSLLEVNVIIEAIIIKLIVMLLLKRLINVINVCVGWPVHFT